MGCGTKRSKHELQRFAVDEKLVLVLDNKGDMAGRGVYCCKESGCLSRFFKKRRKLSKVLRVSDVQINDELQGLFGSE